MVDYSFNNFNSRSPLMIGGRSFHIFRLDALEKAGVGAVSRLPFSIRILLENMLRLENGRSIQQRDIEALACWNPAGNPGKEIAFTPGHVAVAAAVQSGGNARNPGLTGSEADTIEGVSDGVSPGKPLTVRARREDGSELVFTVITRIETPNEVAYYRHGGILPYVLRQLLKN